MKTFANMQQFAEFMDNYEFTLPERMLGIATAAAGLTANNIKDVLGNSDKLAQLSDRTIELSGEHGPLLLDGSIIRNSIEQEAAPLGTGAIMGVGTAEPIAFYHEHGSINIPMNTTNPPRPFFAIGVYKSLPEIQEMLPVLAPGTSVRVRDALGKFASLKKAPEQVLAFGIGKLPSGE